LPEICFELADIYSTPFQIWAGNPGNGYPANYWLPVGMKSINAAGIDTLVGYIQTKSGAHQALAALKLTARPVTFEDVSARKPLSIHSTLGHLWAQFCPTSFKAAGGAVTYQDHIFDAAEDLTFWEHIGMDGCWDLAVGLGTTHTGRTTDIWEALTCAAPDDNSDIGVWYTNLTGSTFTDVTDSNTFLDWIQTVAAGRSSVWSLLSGRQPFGMIIENVSSEPEWNYRAQDICHQLLIGHKLFSRGLPILPDIADVRSYQETVLASAANPAATPLRPDPRQDKRVSSNNSLGQSSMSAGGSLRPVTPETITQGESFGNQGGGSDERPKRRGL
jgi:hypothetical protein